MNKHQRNAVGTEGIEGNQLALDMSARRQELHHAEVPDERLVQHVGHVRGQVDLQGHLGVADGDLGIAKSRVKFQ